MAVVFPLWYADAGGSNVRMSVLMILVCCVMLIFKKSLAYTALGCVYMW